MGFISPTCCDGLDREEPLRLRVSPWHTVSRGLGRMERKSLNDRRWAASVSSAEGRTGATGRGKSLESKGSSVLLYLPKALATPRRVGTTYLHRYTGQEKDLKEANCEILTYHRNKIHYLSTSIMSLRVFADNLQDLHDVHDCLQDLKIRIAYWDSSRRFSHQCPCTWLSCCTFTLYPLFDIVCSLSFISNV